jgi:hypothetical protein
VVAGTATAVSNRVSRRQAERWYGQEDQGYQEPEPAPAQAPAQAQPAAPQVDPLEQLKKLGELKQAGVLTEAEFEAQKAKILAG